MFYIITRDDCPWCDRAKEALNNRGKPYEAFLYTEHPMLIKLIDKAGLKTVPQIWHDKKYVGGCAELYKYLEELDE
jgi:glutaredoxin